MKHNKSHRILAFFITAIRGKLYTFTKQLAGVKPVEIDYSIPIDIRIALQKLDGLQYQHKIRKEY